MAIALQAAGPTATVERNPTSGEAFVQVSDPNAPHRRDQIICRHHACDGCAAWFFFSWRAPISPACGIRSAVAAITRTLQPTNGVPHARP